MAQFAVPAVEAAGKGNDVKIASINAVSANLKFIQDGRVQIVDVGNSNAWLGWAATDRALRAMAGEKPGISTVPLRLFDKSNLGGVNIEDEGALFEGADFRAEYRKLWGR
jgi:ABC-type sugar transport system substrate-binding protein